jgi:hypothetical protein
MKVPILRPRRPRPDPDSVISRLVREGRHTQDEEAELPPGALVSMFDGDHTAYVADDGTIRVYKSDVRPVKSVADINKRNAEFWKRKEEPK